MAAEKLGFTTVYVSTAAPSFAERQNLLAALLMREGRENGFLQPSRLLPPPQVFLAGNSVAISAGTYASVRPIRCFQLKVVDSFI